MENCFKHAGKNNTERLSIIYSLHENDDKLKIFFSNNFIQSEHNPKAIGLKNIESQLSYIYKENYKLRKTVDEGIFKIEITIPAR